LSVHFGQNGFVKLTPDVREAAIGQILAEAAHGKNQRLKCFTFWVKKKLSNVGIFNKKITYDSK
jgi:hypothetical protein